MPFVISYPKKIAKSKRLNDLILNIDIPSLLLDYAGIKSPDSFKGKSFKNALEDSKNLNLENISITGIGNTVQ